MARNPQSRRVLMIALMVGAVLQLGLSACDDQSSEERDQATLNVMRQEIESLVGRPACGEVSGCAFLPFGSKACGGPWSYLVYSKTATDTTALQQLVAEYNAFEDHMNREYGRISDCSVPSPPALDCVDGACVGTSE